MDPLSMIASLGGGLISGVASLFGSNKANKYALQSVRETNQANRELAEYAYEKDLEMWNRQNVYNSPVEQMQRLEEAGLNPNLMYGQGSTGNASSSPSYDAPKMEAYTSFGDLGYGRAGQALMNGLQQYAQIEKTNAEIDAIRQNTLNLQQDEQYKRLQVQYQGLINAKSEFEKEFWLDQITANLANIDSTTQRNFSQAQLNDSNRFYIDAQNDRFKLLTPLIVDTVKADLGQKLFDLYQLSPAKVRNLNSNTHYQNFISKVAEYKGFLLQNELSFSKERVPYAKDFADFEHYMKSAEVEIQKALIQSGINLKGSNWFTPLLYEIWQNIAKPVGQFIDKF